MITIKLLIELTKAVPTKEASGIKACMPFPSWAILSKTGVCRLYPNPKVFKFGKCTFESLYFFNSAIMT
jgi:hypothetical protein